RDLGLGLKGAVGRVEQREDRAGHEEDQRGRHEHLEQREAGFAPSAGLGGHFVFLVFTLTRRASSFIRSTRPASASPRSVRVVTSTCRTSVLFGFVGTGSTDQRRM